MTVKTNYGRFKLVGYRHIHRVGVLKQKPVSLTKAVGAVVLQPDGKNQMLIQPRYILNWQELPEIIDHE